MLKKSCAIILSIALAVGILVHGSFAFSSWGDPDSNWVNVSGVSAMSIEIIETAISENNFEYMLMVHRPSGSVAQDQCVICLSDGVLMNVTQGGFGLCSYSQDLTLKIFYIAADGSILSVENITTYYRDTNWDVHLYWYKNSTGVWWLQDSSVGYSSYDFAQAGNAYPFNPTTYPANLVGLPWQDNRVLNVDKVLYNGVDYIALYTDDVYSSEAWASLRFTDQYGNGTTIIDSEDMIFTQPYDGLNRWLIAPSRVSSYSFTLTSVLYSGSTSWGYKEDDDLSFRFGDSPIPSPIPGVSVAPDYNYNNTNVINYNGGQKDIFYNSYQVTIELYGESSTPEYFTDLQRYLVQPFAFTYILLPSTMYTNGLVYDGFLSDCFYQYDVILDGYSPVAFDYWYGSGALASLQSDLSGFNTGDDVSRVLELWYSGHSPQLYTYPYASEGLQHLNLDYPCLLTLTDSFYFKQTNYLLGDSGDILSQFSDRFYKVGGFSDSVLQNISALYNLEVAFYDSALPALTNLNYFVNGLTINESFGSVIQLLTSVDNYLSSVDGKLSSIDSDFGDLLEWFQNQEDSDVALTLPEFNPSILINIYGENIGDFVEFVQGFVNTLPEFDFSDFPNFFDYAADLVDDTAGSGDDLIGSLFSPYDYDDSGLHEFGWD